MGLNFIWSLNEINLLVIKLITVVNPMVNRLAMKTFMSYEVRRVKNTSPINMLDMYKPIYFGNDWIT